MSDVARIVLVDDHEIVRTGLRTYLDCKEEFQIVGEAGDGHEVVGLCQRVLPDVVVLDLAMPNLPGHEAVKQLKKQRPEIRVLALTAQERGFLLNEAIRAGIDGVVIKDMAATDLVRAIKSVLEGKAFIPANLEGFWNKALEADSAVGLSALTPRELSVLTCIGRGQSNKEISRTLKISPKTVEVHRTNQMAKLGIHKATELAAFAAREGLLPV